MQIFRHRFVPAFLFSLLLLPCFCGTAAAGETRKIEIVQTTDIHGTIGDAKSPGLLQIAGMVRTIKPALWIDCGDLTLGSFSAAMDDGASMVSAMNAAGCDIWVPGNHDFDYGVKVLADRTKLFQGTVLTANIQSKDAPLRSSAWKMFERNGVKIAVIGIVPPYLGLWIAPDKLKGVSMESPDAALARIMPDVMAAKPDVIVLAIHLGEYISSRLNPDGKLQSMDMIAAQYPQINLIFAGHSHQNIPGKRLYSGAWLVQSPPLGSGFTVTTIEVDPESPAKKIQLISSKLINPAGQPEDPAAAAILDPVRKKADSMANKPVAQIDFELAPIKNGTKPNRLAELFGLAMMESVHADAAITGTISNNTVAPGILTERKLFQLVSYRDTVVVRRLTPPQIRVILKELDGKSKTADYMSFTGFTIPNGIDGALVSGASGKAIPEDAKLSVAFGSFAAYGAGGRYPELKKIVEATTPPDGVSSPDLRAAFRQYLQKHYPIKPAEPKKP